MDEVIELGDIVTVGANALTWEVVTVPEFSTDLVWCKSGQSERWRRFEREKLRIHTKKKDLPHE